MTRYKKADFEKVIPGSGGIISTIADRVGCNWHTAKSHIEKSPDLREAVEAERKKKNDIAVSIYQQNIIALHHVQQYSIRLAQKAKDKGDIPGYIKYLEKSIVPLEDVKWWLRMQAKDLGFVERQEHAGVPDAPIEIKYVNHWRDNQGD
jgi:hypothetical protein